MKKQLALSMYVLSLVLGAALVARAEDQKVDDEGFVRHWLLLAPIKLSGENTGAEEIDKEQIKDEGRMRPKAGEKAKAGDKELVWKEIKAKEYFFDVNEILGEQMENVAAYAVAYIVSPEEMKDVQIHMGSNDQGKVYLNGKEVLKFSETRALDGDPDSVTGLTLNKGVNLIVFKVINENNNWQGCLRFKDKGGAPIKTVKVRTSPE